MAHLAAIWLRFWSYESAILLLPKSSSSTLDLYVYMNVSYLRSESIQNVFMYLWPYIYIYVGDTKCKFYCVPLDLIK